MVHFPLLQHLTVEKYGLYPGPEQSGRFEIVFSRGITLILGANGLGKSTLMLLLFRLIAGTHDIALPEGDVGTANLEIFEINPRTRRQLAGRVHDEAKDARALLQFSLAGRRFEVERRLSDLALIRCHVDGQVIGEGENSYQSAVVSAAGLGSYADWILILRTLVFFFEDRRALVWDAGAQRQLLRALLLSPTQAQTWTEKERAILGIDSRMRNLQASLKREQRERAKTITQVDNLPGVRAALAAAEVRLGQLNEEHERLVQRIDGIEESRHRARLDALRAQAQHDQALRELERAKFIAIDSLLPRVEESMRFLLARLMSDRKCLACGTEGVEAKREVLEAAIGAHRCVVCDSELKPSDSAVAAISNE